MIAIFVDGTNDHYTRGYNFPIGTTPKKFSVSELGVIFWGSPLFLAVFGHSHFRGATTLNFGSFSTKLGGIVRDIEKMTVRKRGSERKEREKALSRLRSRLGGYEPSVGSANS